MENKLLQFLILSVCCSIALSCHGSLLYTGITGDERRIILQEHNRLRQSVATGHVAGQPSAENMREMVWDDELAARAQQWATNCQFKHDPQRTINRFTMGQNLAIIWSTVPLEDDDGDFPSRIQGWFNEVQKYSFGSAWSPKTGHYSQLVWGETNLVGCGFAYYKDGIKYNKLYVCNYGPGGNVVGVNPYEVGRPSCRNYGMKPSSKYQGLCYAQSGGASPSAGISQNRIDTYDNKKTDFNSKTSYSTAFHHEPQQAKHKVSLSSYFLQRFSKIQKKSSSSFEISNIQPSIQPSIQSSVRPSIFKSLLSSTEANNAAAAGVTHSQLQAQAQAQAQAQVRAQARAQAQAQAQADAQAQAQVEQLQSLGLVSFSGSDVTPSVELTTADVDFSTTKTTTTADPTSTYASLVSRTTPESIILPQSGWSLLTWRG